MQKIKAAGSVREFLGLRTVNVQQLTEQFVRQWAPKQRRREEFIRSLGELLDAIGMSPVLHINRAAMPVFQVDHSRLNDEALYRLMDQSEMMLWASGPDMGNLHCTPALLRYMGRTAEELLQMGWAEAVHPADRERMLESSAATYPTREPFYVIYRLRRANGSYGLMLDVAEPRWRPDGTFGGYIGTMREIKEQEQLL